MKAIILLFSFLFLYISFCYTSEFYLLKNCDVYAPEPLGIKDILIGGTKILGMYKKNSSISFPSPFTVIDMNNALALPGIIDPHMHVSGGGGENGPYSRTPNSQLSQVIDAGITTMVGLRGTDGITRSSENVLQFLYSLEEMGLSSWMWTGSYHVPVDTLTSTIERDIILVEKIIGVGEIAISDHRSSWPSYQQLVEIVSSCRVAGMLSGKVGIAHFHIGDAETKLDPLWSIVNKTTIPITQMYPTHVSRTQALTNEGIKWIQNGGYLDFTADAANETATANALNQYIIQGLDMNHVTLSSDSYGSLPVYDSTGNLIAYDVASPSNLINQIKTMIQKYNWPIPLAFSLATNNTASYLGFKNKGNLEIGKHADIIILNQNTLDLTYVFAKGQLLKSPQGTATAMFNCM